MTQIGTTSLEGLFHEDFEYPFLVSGTVTEADEGKAVTLDATAANTVKLAGDGDVIIGRLNKLEVRAVEGITIGTISMMGGLRFPVDSGLAAADVPDVGEYLHGATVAGTVKGNTTASKWLVVEMASDDSYAIAVAI